jgi:hypothetical protein
MTTLPVELQHAILLLLDTRTLLRVGRTCRCWRSLSCDPSLWVGGRLSSDPRPWRTVPDYYLPLVTPFVTTFDDGIFRRDLDRTARLAQKAHMHRLIRHGATFKAVRLSMLALCGLLRNRDCRDALRTVTHLTVIDFDGTYRGYLGTKSVRGFIVALDRSRTLPLLHTIDLEGVCTIVQRHVDGLPIPIVGRYATWRVTCGWAGAHGIVINRR